MRWRRTRCTHSPLLAELEALRIENARLTAQLAYFRILHWMHAAIVQRDQQARAEQHRAERLQGITEEIRERR